LRRASITVAGAKRGFCVGTTPARTKRWLPKTATNFATNTTDQGMQAIDFYGVCLVAGTES
jgi:hypothetical protein